ncbi:MAG: protein kinase, partial [Myxococcota bacterium]
LVHRDLKPANVLLASTVEGFVPKVTDFGLAKIMIDIPGLAHTKQGISMGTPSYMAPEQIRDAGSVDQRADLWSLGCLLYELMTRRRAFPGDEALSIYNAVVDASFTSPRQWAPELPDRVNDAILGCLQLDPDDRIPDCATLLEVLQGRLEWDVQTSVVSRQRAWSDEEETADPLEAGLPAQFALDGPDVSGTASLGDALELEKPGQSTVPVDVSAAGLDATDLITDDDIVPPIAVVQADTTGFDRRAAAMLDDEAPTVAVRLQERILSGDQPPLGTRRPRTDPSRSRAPVTFDSFVGSRPGAPHGPRAATVLGLGAAAVLLTAIALGASASVLGYVMSNGAVKDAPIAPASAVAAEVAPVETEAPRAVTKPETQPVPTAVAVVQPSAPVKQPAAPPTEPPPVPRVAASGTPEASPTVIEAHAPDPTPPSAPLAAPEPPARETDGAAGPPLEVRLFAQPLAVQVFIDGQYEGRTPLKMDLGQGPHTVQWISQDQRSESFAIDVTPGQNSWHCYRFADQQKFD